MSERYKRCLIDPRVCELSDGSGRQSGDGRDVHHFSFS